MHATKECALPNRASWPRRKLVARDRLRQQKTRSKFDSRTGLYCRASGPQLWVLLCMVCEAVQKEHMGGMCSRPLSRVVALVREMRMVPVATTGLILIDSWQAW